MAGIGFVLRRLARRDDLLGIVQGYAYSAFVSSGPWLFTVLAIAAVTGASRGLVARGEAEVFRLVLSYNFCFSLVLSGPLLMVLTRWLADSIYAREVEKVPGVFVACFCAVALGGLLAAGPFYWIYADLPRGVAAVAVANFVAVSGIWLVSTFLSALKDYRSIALAFGAGALLAVAAGYGLSRLGVEGGVLLGFTLGLLAILFALVAKLLAEYPYPFRPSRDFLLHFRRYPELAATGLVGNAAIWVDKWVLWFAPEADAPGHGLVSYSAYDGAMFFAYLSIVPAMAVFIVNVETGFYEAYKRYYAEIQHHVDLDRIRANRRGIARVLIHSSRGIAVLQTCVAAIVLLGTPALIDAGLLVPQQLGMFRYGVLGSAFQVMFVFCCIVLAYFDRRMDVLWLQAVYLALNGGLSALFMALGYPFYGYGYFLASLIVMVLAYLVCLRRVQDLDFLTFLRQNTSV
jgi:uncharacterized membrane protein